MTEQDWAERERDLAHEAEHEEAVAMTNLPALCEAVAKPTPYYSHAGITIYHGDCRDILPHVTADVVVTDPPYDAPVIIECPGNSLSFFAPEHRPSGRIDEFLFWFKTPSTKNTVRKCSRFVEMIAVRRNGPTFNRLHWSQMTGAYDDRHIGPELLHPWEKPLSLIDRLVRIYSNSGDTILDPFMGSGTTLVAAKQLGRKVIGIEIEERYCEIAAKRLSQRVMFGVTP